MKAIIPTNGNAGREDTVSSHFGSAPFFTIYDVDSDETTVVENDNSGHQHGTCHPISQLTKFKADCVVCTGMGRRAIEILSSGGIKVYRAESKKVGEVVDSIKAGDMKEIDPAKACQGHGHRGGCSHGPFSRGMQK